MNVPSHESARGALAFAARLAIAAVMVVALPAWARSDSPDPGSGGLKPSKESKSGGRGKGKGEGKGGSEIQRPGPSRGPGAGKRDTPFSGLSEDETQRMREVLAKVWQDPAVMAAKEGVRLSTDEYRNVLKEAVMRVDPEVAALMNKFHEGSHSAEMRQRFEEHMGRGGGRPGRPGGPGMRPGGGEGISDLPEFLRALDDEKKEIYLAARRKVEASGKVAGLRKEMTVLENKERASREERFKFMMRMRRTMREEMIRIDPRVAEFLPEAPKSRPGKGERPERPKGDGTGKDRPPGGR